MLAKVIAAENGPPLLPPNLHAPWAHVLTTKVMLLHFKNVFSEMDDNEYYLIRHNYKLEYKFKFLTALFGSFSDIVKVP